MRRSLLCVAVLGGFGAAGGRAWAEPPDDGADIITEPQRGDVVPAAGVTVQVFYEALAPYGSWVYLGPYGRVWRPSPSVVGIEFRPYVTGGRWVYTDVGWAFASDYDWGWAPFHYGRWVLATGYGWVWVPGTDWGPAWVEWRMGDGYVGWAPLPPGGDGLEAEYSPYWCFTPTGALASPGLARAVVVGPRAAPIFARSAPVRRTVYSHGLRFPAGPRVGVVRSYARAPLAPRHVTPPRPGVVAPIHVGRRARGP
ncbi:MAG TPA: DUF6600 domain-containing protein [Polyangia bacterium]|jgi:hypothetical protein